MEEQKEKIVFIANLNTLEHNFEKINIKNSKEDLDNLNHQLNEILGKTNNFEEILILNNEGFVIAATNLESIGRSEFRDVEFLEGKSGAQISEIHYSDVLKKLVIDVSVNVFTDETEEKLGIVVAEIALEELAEITTSKFGLGETEEVFIVNEEKYLLTPSRFLRGENKGILTQIVDTEGVRNCLKMVDMNTKEHKDHEPVSSFLDYRAEKVIGSHFEILEADWCLIAEINEEEALGIPHKQFLKNQAIVSALLVATVTLSGFAVGMFLDKRYTLKNRNIDEN